MRPFSVWMSDGEVVVPPGGAPAMRNHVPDLTMRPLPRWRPVIEEICRRHRVTWREFVRGYADRRYVACRHEVWWTIRERFGASYPDIGRRTGGFHHSTVLIAVRAYDQNERKAA